VKSSHHAVFDEAWYMQPHRPPAAQLLYNLGLEAEDCMVSEIGPDVLLTHALYPPSLPMGVLVSWRYVGYLQSYTFFGQKKAR
jgi:hypothetical protein